MSNQGQHPTTPSGTRGRQLPTLRRRLITLLGSMLLVTLVLIGVGVFLYISHNEREDWQGRQRQAALAAGETVAAFLQRAEAALGLVGALERDYLHAEPQALADLIQRTPALLEVIRLDQYGIAIAVAYQDAPVLANQFTIPQSNWFIQARAGQVYLGSLQISAESKPYLLLAMPAPDGGVVASRLDMNRLWEVVAGIRFGETGQAYVVNTKGRVIAHPEPDLVLAQTSLAGRPEMVALSQSPTREWSGSYANFEGTRVVGVTAPVPGTSWVVVTELTQAEASSVSRTALLLLGGGMLLFGTLMVWATSLLFLGRLIIQPIEVLRAGAERLGRGDLAHRIHLPRQDEVGQLATTLNQMAGELQQLRQQEAARTGELERRAIELATAADIGRAAASVLDPATLAQEVVELVRSRFGFYYAGLFLLDERGEYAVLEAGTGEPGRIMKERGHRLEVGGVSMVGAACAQRQARIAADVGAESIRFDNPLLPETRSEMALPLMVGDRVLGALDVQSSAVGAFSEGDIAVLQLAADQVAVAVDNARKFSEEATLLEATSPLFRASRRLATAITSEEVAQAIISSVSETELDGCAIAQFGYSPPPDEQVETITFLGSWNRDGDSRFPTGVLFPVSAGHFPLLLTTTFWTVENATLVYLPLRAGERVIGFLILQRAAAGPLPAVLLRFYETLVDQAAVALERARLLEEAQRRAAREQSLGQITARFARSLDLDTVLRTAVRDLGELLQVDEVAVFVAPPEASPRSDGGGRDG